MFTPISLCNNVSLTMQASRAFHMICRSNFNLECCKRSPQLITVRHRKIPARKPFWLPVAKSKLFRIKEKTIIPEDELDQTRDLQSHYKAEMDSIMVYFAAENEKNELTQQHTALESDFSHLLILNKEENERVRKIRESVLALELENEKQALLEKEQVEKEWFLAKKKEVDSIIKYEKLQSVNFINMENLEHAISEAIDKPVSYNFAIDQNGSIVWEDTARGSEASAYWTDDVPRQKLNNPPSQPPPVRFKRKAYVFVTDRRWY